MENNSQNHQTRRTLAWLGTGCSVVILVIGLCPCAISALGLANFFADPADWFRDDTVYFSFFAITGLIGLLIGGIIGGFSISYLIRGPKNSSKESSENLE